MVGILGRIFNVTGDVYNVNSWVPVILTGWSNNIGVSSNRNFYLDLAGSASNLIVFSGALTSADTESSVQISFRNTNNITVSAEGVRRDVSEHGRDELREVADQADDRVVLARVQDEHARTQTADQLPRARQ
jgi:hypothetical protein